MSVMRRMALALLMTCVSEGAVAQEPSWWTSRYGEADTLGALNNLSPEGVKKAARLVTTGKVYALGVPTGPDTPAYGNRTYKVERLSSGGSDFTSDGSERVTAWDERVTTSMGIGTQIDGLAHLGVDHHYYNGVPGSLVASSYVLDLASIPAIVTRGVLIDMTRQFGKPMLEVGDVYNRKEIEAAMKAQKITIRKGDVVIFHTGWLRMAGIDRDTFRSREPGLGAEGAQFLADLGVVAIGSDTVALEAIPFETASRPFLVHQTLLAKNGVHILETLNTAELAADGVREFLFVLGAPRMQGTVQMVINPVAIR